MAAAARMRSAWAGGSPVGSRGSAPWSRLGSGSRGVGCAVPASLRRAGRLRRAPQPGAGQEAVAPWPSAACVLFGSALKMAAGVRGGSRQGGRGADGAAPSEGESSSWCCWHLPLGALVTPRNGAVGTTLRAPAASTAALGVDLAVNCVLWYPQGASASLCPSPDVHNTRS